MIKREIILKFLQEHKEEMRRKFYVKKIGLFGSYAKNCATKDSDIDIVIKSDKKDFFLRDDLREFLEEKLGVSVDVGYQDSFRDYYKNRIEKDIIYV